jgi:hypothetical protein
MSRTRWIALAVTMLALVTAILYPPFGFTDPEGSVYGLGLHLLFRPPTVSIADQSYARSHVRVRSELLAGECAVIVLIGGLAFSLGGKR